VEFKGLESQNVEFVRDPYRNRGSNLTPSCSCRLWNQGTWNQVSDLPAAGVGLGTVLIATG
jgi:hypothetical protein